MFMISNNSLLYIQLILIGEIAHLVPCHSLLAPHTMKASVSINQYLHTSDFSLNFQRKFLFGNKKERYNINYKTQFLIPSIASS